MAQSSAASGTSRRHLREHDISSPGSPRYPSDNEWGSKEALLCRELEEAKGKMAQMEKTMRWWSDCTTNWREKWCKVRDERNKARKEAKILKEKLESVFKESQDLEIQNDQFKKEIKKIHAILLKHAGQFDQQLISLLNLDTQLKTVLDAEDLLDVYNNINLNENLTSSLPIKDCSLNKCTLNDSVDVKSMLEKDIEEYISQGAVPKHAVEMYKETSYNVQEKRHSQIDAVNEDVLVQKIFMLNLRLEEAAKTITAERDEKSLLHCEMEKLRNEILLLKERCEELQISRTEAMKELLELKGRLQGELSAAQADLIDEATNREGMDRRLSELRSELEKLQAENATEWGKRERLESEKISLERENKQLRNELRDYQDRIDSRRTRPASSCDADTKQLQQELLDRNKELIDLKHLYAKLKKMLSEKAIELSHAARRSEQYEAEVKRIRTRVEELKKDLALAQDDVDVANSSIKRLQRVNNDLTQQLDIMTLQLENYGNSISDNRASDVAAAVIDEEPRVDICNTADDET